MGGPPGLLASKEIWVFNFGHTDSPVLAVLRRVLRLTCAVASKARLTARIRLKLPGALTEYYF